MRCSMSKAIALGAANVDVLAKNGELFGQVTVQFE